MHGPHGHAWRRHAWHRQAAHVRPVLWREGWGRAWDGGLRLAAPCGQWVPQARLGGLGHGATGCAAWRPALRMLAIWLRPRGRCCAARVAAGSQIQPAPCPQRHAVAEWHARAWSAWVSTPAAWLPPGARGAQWPLKPRALRPLSARATRISPVQTWPLREGGGWGARAVCSRRASGFKRRCTGGGCAGLGKAAFPRTAKAIQGAHALPRAWHARLGCCQKRRGKAALACVAWHTRDPALAHRPGHAGLREVPRAMLAPLSLGKKGRVAVPDAATCRPITITICPGHAFERQKDPPRPVEESAAGRKKQGACWGRGPYAGMRGAGALDLCSIWPWAIKHLGCGRSAAKAR